MQNYVYHAVTCENCEIILQKLHPDKSVHHKYVLELTGNFRKTGSVQKYKPFQVVTDVTAAVAILGYVAALEETQFRQFLE